MAKKYKIKITKAYHIAIEDKDGYEVESDWSFLDYKEAKKIAEKMLAEVELGVCKPMPLPKEIEDRMKAYFQENMKKQVSVTTEHSCDTCKYRELYECSDCRFASKWERIEVE